jgi:hypothetical protein
MVRRVTSRRRALIAAASPKTVMAEMDALSLDCLESLASYAEVRLIRVEEQRYETICE